MYYRSLIGGNIKHAEKRARYHLENQIPTFSLILCVTDNVQTAMNKHSQVFAIQPFTALVSVMSEVSNT